MKELSRLSRKQLKSMFGIESLPELTQEERQANKAVNDVFDAVAFRCGIREWEIFKGAYPKREDLARKRMSAFLQCVRTCPKKVLKHAEKLLKASKKK